MGGLHFCSMRITEEVRKHAAEQGLTDKTARRQGWKRREPSSRRPAKFSEKCDAHFDDSMKLVQVEGYNLRRLAHAMPEAS